MTIRAGQDLTRMIDAAIRIAEGESSNENVKRYTVRGVTQGKARDGGVLIMEGADLKHFLANPQLQYGHGSSEFAGVPASIGRVVEVRAAKDDEGNPAFDFDFEIDLGVSDLGDQVARMLDAEILNAVSIGFRVTSFQWGHDMEDDERAALGNPEWVGRQWELYELSVVGVGADPRALVQRSFGADSSNGMTVRAEFPPEHLAAMEASTAAMRELTRVLGGYEAREGDAKETDNTPETSGVDAEAFEPDSAGSDGYLMRELEELKRRVESRMARNERGQDGGDAPRD